ncbi:class I SAM-dependent methyltransferase [Rhodovibrio sodomensis]|nr:class I SAM-dependent methyltransferase [Rhodovibrio sodomensis]
MRNENGWRPSKIDWQPDGSWRIRSTGVGAGSLLTATLQQAALIPLVRRHVRGDVADIGAGEAPFYGGYRDQALSIVCVDWGQSLHDVGRHSDHLADLNVALPLDSESVDAALMSSVLEHIAEPKRLLSEVARVLRTGGALVLEVPFLYWLHEEPHDYHRYTCHALKHMAEQAGLEVEALEAYGHAPAVLVDIQSKLAITLIDGAVGRAPRRVRGVMRRVGHGVVRLYQRLALAAFNLPWVRRALQGSRLQASFPLGYVAVLRRKAAA